MRIPMGNLLLYNQLNGKTPRDHFPGVLPFFPPTRKGHSTYLPTSKTVLPPTYK